MGERLPRVTPSERYLVLSGEQNICHIANITHMLVPKYNLEVSFKVSLFIKLNHIPIIHMIKKHSVVHT